MGLFDGRTSNVGQIDVTFQILSLSGGGFFGLYSISVLAELERQVGAPIASRFDLLAGTSIGTSRRCSAVEVAAVVSLSTMVRRKFG